MLWVRGDRRFPFAQLEVSDGNGQQTKTVELEERHGYTGVATFTRLSASTQYRCEVQFSARANSHPSTWVDFGHCRGQFRTAPDPNVAEPFSFLLGSCNLHSLGPISSPDRAFEELNRKAEANDARFMIHCGDQIYYDVPLFAKAPEIQEYRDKYLDAWGDSRPTRRFLTLRSQYMILDDHEITNDFANDFRSPNPFSTPQQYRQIATKVYREFVNIRQPQNFGDQALYYSFNYGTAQFFVLDTRTERFAFQSPSSDNQIIGQDQMRAFKSWLRRHANELKFVVSSVPFVGEVRNDVDKWSAQRFEQQKHEVVDFIHDNAVGKLVFLTGDMHSSYHATMTITHDNQNLVVHELMSSPVNQLEKSAFDRYVIGRSHSTAAGTRYVSRIQKREFYNDHSNAMLISVDGGQIDWEIFRTKRSARGRSGRFTV